MLKINSYSAKGVKLTPIALPKEWEVTKNPNLLAQAIRVYNDRSHVGLRKAQTRAEVNRTTKKLYRQKGTGGARHGSRKAPIFVGGGVAGGPRPVKRILNLPQSMKQKALRVALSELVKESKVIAADLSFKKTSETAKFVTKVLGKNNPKVTFVLAKDSKNVSRNLSNLTNSKVVRINNLNAFDVFYAGNLIFDKNIFAKTKEDKK